MDNRPLFKFNYSYLLNSRDVRAVAFYDAAENTAVKISDILIFDIISDTTWGPRWPDASLVAFVHHRICVLQHRTSCSCKCVSTEP